MEARVAGIGDRSSSSARSSGARDVGVYELVEVLEDLLAELKGKEDWLGGRLEASLRAEDLIDKLVGPERETASRWSSRHILVDEAACEDLAADLAISPAQARLYFLGEPVKRAQRVASWCLDEVDQKIMENGAIHGQRGRMVADLLDSWARRNQAGLYRDVVPEERGA